MSDEAYPLQGMGKDEEFLSFPAMRRIRLASVTCGGILPGERSSGPHGGSTRRN